MHRQRLASLKAEARSVTSAIHVVFMILWEARVVNVTDVHLIAQCSCETQAQNCQM